MAPTSDERREVAEQLREARPSTYYAEELAELIEDSLLPAFPTETWREPTDVLSALADLIDPTCEVVGTTSEEGLYGPTIFHHKLSCGHMCDTGWPEPPKYCDACGRRVIDGE